MAPNTADQLKAITDTRTALLAGLAAVGALGTFWLNARTQRFTAETLRISEANFELAERGHLTDRYTYRMSYLRRRTEVPWEALRAQFGSNLADTKQGRAQFRRDFDRNLREVVLVYRDANVEVSPGGVVLLPSRTHVPARRTAGQLD
jgi:hypothetical protein